MLKTEATVDVSIIDDDQDEPDEAFEITVTSLQTAIVLTPVIRITISDVGMQLRYNSNKT